MDLRSSLTISRKKEDARNARERGIVKSREAKLKRSEARQKQLKEEQYDRQSTKSQSNSNRLRHEREKAVNQIERYQVNIDTFTAKITECKKRD